MSERLQLVQWVLGDLNVFRDWREREFDRTGREPGQHIRNTDGTFFRAYRVTELPTSFIVTIEPPLPEVQLCELCGAPGDTAAIVSGGKHAVLCKQHWWAFALEDRDRRRAA
jgi:hypothetical protein